MTLIKNHCCWLLLFLGAHFLHDVKEEEDRTTHAISCIHDRDRYNIRSQTMSLSSNCCQHVSICQDNMLFVANFWPTSSFCTSHDQICHSSCMSQFAILQLGRDWIDPVQLSSGSWPFKQIFLFFSGTYLYFQRYLHIILTIFVLSYRHKFIISSYQFIF